MNYSINYSDGLIKYKKTTVPPDINFIDYLEFEINDYNYVLNENDIERIFGGFIENYVEEYPNENEYKILLTKINDMLLDISHLTVKELYNELKEPDFTNTYVDEWLPFDDSFFNEFFPNSTPQEIAEIVYFSKIYSWNDQYARFTSKDRIETSNYRTFSTNPDKTLEQWISENFKNY